MTLHSGLTGTSLHTLVAYTWANAAARAAFVAVAADVGKMGFQSDTTTFYMIRAVGNSLDEIGAAGGGGSGNTVEYDLHNFVATIRAGETLSANDAVALVAFEQDGPLIMKADCNAARFKRSFLGFATAGVAVTQGDYTFSSSTVITGDVSFDLNGRAHTVAFNTDHDTTILDIATAINGDPDIASATRNVVGGTDNDTITILSGNGVSAAGSVTVLIDNGSGTGFTLVFATNTVAAGGNVDITNKGPMGGFAGMPGNNAPMYLSNTAGTISSSDDGGCQIVGFSLDATNLLVEPQLPPIPSDLLNQYVSHGLTTFGSGATATDTTEEYNFISWNTLSVTSGTVRHAMQIGQSQFQGSHYAVSGSDNAGSLENTAQSFNKISWSAEAVPTNSRISGSISALNSLLYAWKGSNNAGSGGADATRSDNVDEYNGTSWGSTVVAASNVLRSGLSVEGGLLHSINGINTGGTGQDVHETFNGTTLGSDTTIGDAGGVCGSCPAPNGTDMIIINEVNAVANWFVWNGTTWTSLVSVDGQHWDSSGTTEMFQGPAMSQVAGAVFMNHGSDIGNATHTDAVRFNGTSFVGDTAADVAKGGVAGSTV